MRYLFMASTVALLTALSSVAFADQTLRGVVAGRGPYTAVTLNLKPDNTPGAAAGYLKLSDPFQCTLRLRYLETEDGKTGYAISYGDGGFCARLGMGRISVQPGQDRTLLSIFDSSNTERLSGWVTPVAEQP